MSTFTSKTAFKPVLSIALTAFAFSASFSAFGQYSPYGQSTQTFNQPTALNGYSPDGVLYMGGQKIGNPHQIFHDAEIPSFMTITANRYTYTNDPAHPNYGQGTLAQMEAATTAGSDSSLLLNRLYLTANNPYPVVPTGTHNNFQTYANALTNAQATGYKAITADDGKAYAVKTLTAANTQAQNILVRELPNTSQFRAAADPAGGAVGVRVTQNGDAVALANYMSTVTPYNFAAQPNFGVYGSTGSNFANANQYQFGNQIPEAWAAAMAWQNAHNGSNGNFNSENIASANFFNGMPNNWIGSQIGRNNSVDAECWFPAPCAQSSNGIGVSFDRGFSYKNQFYIFNGGDETQRASMQKDVEGIMNTQRGQDLTNILNQRNDYFFLPKPFYFEITKNDSAGVNELNGNRIYIDPNMKTEFQSPIGMETVTTQRVLAHEFGHAVGGVGDLKREDHDEPKNVRVWENPIMAELGERPRITYFTENDVYKKTDTDTTNVSESSSDDGTASSSDFSSGKSGE